MDDTASTPIDDMVMRYFSAQGFDLEQFIKLRLFFIAQLDDYLRAVKSTKMVQTLMDFPVESAATTGAILT